MCEGMSVGLGLGLGLGLGTGGCGNVSGSVDTCVGMYVRV